jgi:alcohol dehydrogenase class IV
MKKPTVFRMKTEVVHGCNVLNNILEYIEKFKAKNIFVVTDEGIVKAGLIEKLEKILNQKNIKHVTFDGVLPNPPIPVVEKGVLEAKKNNTDLIIAIGGGSSIDVAKAINIVLTNGGDIIDYSGVDKVNKATLPLIAIPTTCGTGSEVTWSTVITNPDEEFKFAVLSNENFPDVAIIDTMLMSNLPPNLTASTGMDALTHALEAYVSVKSQHLSDSLAIYAIELISDNLRKAVLYQDNIENISNMAIASTIAGVAFSNGLLGLVHAMAHPLGGMFNIPHGVANAILLPYVMKFNITSNPNKFAKIAEAMGEDITGLNEMEAGKKSLDAVVKLSRDVGIPDNLKDVGMDISKIDKLAEDSMKSGNVFSNPRKNTIDDIKQIFKDAYEGNL